MRARWSLAVCGVMPATRAFNQILAHYGLVRLGGAFPVEHYPQAIERLARVSGIKFLPNIPFCATGASAAGGASARAANLFHERCAAAAPTLAPISPGWSSPTVVVAMGSPPAAS